MLGRNHSNILEQPTQKWEIPTPEIMLPELYGPDFTRRQEQRLLDSELGMRERLRVINDVLEQGGDFSKHAEREHAVTIGMGPDDYIDGKAPGDRKLEAAVSYLEMRQQNRTRLFHDGDGVYESLTPDQKEQIAQAPIKARHTMLKLIHADYRQIEEKAETLITDLQEELLHAVEPEVVIARLNQPAPDRLRWLEQMEAKRAAARREAERQAAREAAAERVRAERQAAEQAEALRQAKAKAEIETVAKVGDAAAAVLAHKPKPQELIPDELAGKRFGVKVKKDDRDVALTIKVPRPSAAARDAAETISDLSDDAKDKIGKAAVAGVTAGVIAVGLASGSSPSAQPVVPGERDQVALIQPQQKAPVKAPNKAAQVAAKPTVPHQHDTGGTAAFSGNIPQTADDPAVPIFADIHSKASINKANKARTIEHAQQEARAIAAKATQGVIEQKHTKKTIEAIDRLVAQTIANRTRGEMSMEAVQKLTQKAAMVMGAARRPLAAEAELKAQGLKLHASTKEEKRLKNLLLATVFADAEGYTKPQKIMIATMWAKTVSAHTLPNEKQAVRAHFKAEVPKIAWGEKSQRTHAFRKGGAMAVAASANMVNTHESEVHEMVPKIIKALAWQESHGDFTQSGSAGGARGKYQYIDSTWRDSARRYYPLALKYAQANHAPESIQDAVAYREYAAKFKEFDGDLFKIAVSHFYPAANQNRALLDVIPPANVITPRQYAEKFMHSIKHGGEWEKLPLKLDHAPGFHAGILKGTVIKAAAKHLEAKTASREAEAAQQQQAQAAQAAAAAASVPPPAQQPEASPEITPAAAPPAVSSLVENGLKAIEDSKEALQKKIEEAAAAAKVKAKVDAAESAKTNIEGAINLGMHDTYANGEKISKRLYAIEGLNSSGEESTPGNMFYIEGANGHAIVSQEIAESVAALVKEADKRGITLSVLSSFRSNEHQAILAAANPDRNEVAAAGYSNHQGGMALDFDIGSELNATLYGTENGETPNAGNRRIAPGSKVWLLLNEIAKKHGLEQYWNEPWHWSPGGN